MSRLRVSTEAVAMALGASEERADKLLGGLTRPQANWRPDAHSWSVWQCVDHLGRTNVAYAGALQQAVSSSEKANGSTSEFAPGWFGSWFVGRVEPPVRTKFKAPGKIVPAIAGDMQDVLAAFKRSHGPLRRVLESAATVDLNRVRFRNPFVPLVRFTVATGLLIVSAHDRRHLWQAEGLTKLPQFPRS
jgi:hypothetical protein